MNKEIIKGFKGFNLQWKCNDYQFKVGETFKHEGSVELCQRGFHLCEHPLDVFKYYAPGESVFAEVEAHGKTDKATDDTKVVCSEIHIKAEVSFHAMVQAAVKFVFDRAKWTDKNTVDGVQEAAKVQTNSGAASATGYSGAASATGKHGVASSLGIYGTAKGAVGVWLVLSEWVEDSEEKYGWRRVSVKAVEVDGNKIKADTFYTLKNGKFVEA